MSERCYNCGRYFEPDGAECNDYGEVMYYRGDTEFCSDTCREEYPKKQKEQQERWERERKKEQEEQEKKRKYEYPNCVWCGKSYVRKESMATNQGIYCCRKCEAEARGYRPK